MISGGPPPVILPISALEDSLVQQVIPQQILTRLRSSGIPGLPGSRRVVALVHANSRADGRDAGSRVAVSDLRGGGKTDMRRAASARSGRGSTRTLWSWKEIRSKTSRPPNASRTCTSRANT